jgi:hypothetical protein
MLSPLNCKAAMVGGTRGRDAGATLKTGPRGVPREISGVLSERSRDCVSEFRT